MVEDFEDYADLNSGATATSIREAADSPGTHATTMQSIVDDLADDSQQIRSNVEGDIEDATTMNLDPASTAARRLTQSGLFAVGLLNSFADTVETFDTEVETINELLHDNTYARWQAEISSTSDNSEAGSGSDGDALTYDQIKGEEKAKLQGRYNTAHETLETEADRVAGLFEGSPDLADVKELVLAGYIPLQYAGIWPNLQLTDEERKQAQLATVGEMTPAEQVEYVKNTDDIDPAIADVISPEAQEILAGDVADDIKDNKIDASTVAIMGLLQSKQPFAHALHTQVSPNQFADAIQRMSNDVFQVGSTSMPDAEDAQVYADFLAAAGASLATYSKGEGEYAPPHDLSDTWFRAITDENNPENAAALTLMIKHGGQQTSFDPEFLGDLTNQVYDWERDHDGVPVWGPLSDQLGQGYGIKDPSIDYGDTDDPYDNIVTYQTPYDGLANLLSGMEKTPEAAEHFFTYESDGTYVDQVGYKDVDVNEKLKYLLADRRWPTDDGDGLGIALEGATLNSRDEGAPGELTPGERSARLASQTMFIIANEVGRGDSWRPGDDGWQVPHGMTDSVGKIIGGYIPDLNRIAQGSGEDITGNDWIWGDSDGEGSGGLPVGMLASNSDMEKVLQSIGRGDDKTGMEYVTAAALDYHNDVNARLIDEARMPDGSKPQTIADLRESNLESLLNDEASRGGRTLSMIMENGFLGGKAEEKASQEERDAIAKAFGAATDFIPTPQGKIAGFLTSEGLSMLGDQIKSQPSSVTQAWADDSDQAINDSLNFQTYNALLENGFLGPDDPDGLPASAIVEGPNGQPQVDPNLYNGNFDEVDPVAQREFNAWLADRAYSGPGQASINAYASNLPNFD